MSTDAFILVCAFVVFFWKDSSRTVRGLVTWGRREDSVTLYRASFLIHILYPSTNITCILFKCQNRRNYPLGLSGQGDEGLFLFSSEYQSTRVLKAGKMVHLDDTWTRQ